MAMVATKCGLHCPSEEGRLVHSLSVIQTRRLQAIKSPRQLNRQGLQIGVELERVVHVEFNRVRRHVEALHFFPLELDVGIDLIVAHHVATLQEVTVGIQRV